MQPYGEQNRTTVIIERNLNLPTVLNARHPLSREVTLQVLAHSPAEREKWNNLTQSGREDLLDHLEQALAYHVATDRRKERTYQVDVNDLMFITRLIPITDQQFITGHSSILGGGPTSRTQSSRKWKRICGSSMMRFKQL